MTICWLALEFLEVVTVAPLSGAEQAARLAHLVARTGLDPWDAHAAAIADAAIYPILTLNAAKWEPPSADLDDPLHIIEIADLVTRNLGYGADAGRGRGRPVR